jgi:serine/threonine protein phosphatase 1
MGQSKAVEGLFPSGRPLLARNRHRVTSAIRSLSEPSKSIGGREDVFVRRETILRWNWLAADVPKTKPRVPDGRRVYAIGDVHGCADLLSDLFMRIDDDLRARPTADSVQVFLGDYIDRGPNSRQVIDLMIARRRQHDVLFLKGNHEDCVLRLLTDPTVLSEWQNMGGLATLLSYGVMGTRGDGSPHDVSTTLRRAMPDSHRRFIEGLALSFTSGDFFFVHAGARPGIPLQRQSRWDLLWIRDDFLLHEEDFGMVVVHGHTPIYEPEIRWNRINIDTGAYATGKLTCLVLEGDQMGFL